MRGIVSIAGYVPYRRLQRSEISGLLGSGGGRGTRAVASHDEDTTTMGVEAARLALRAVPGAAADAVWFATATPAYLDKTNAATLHAALRQPAATAAFDFGGGIRSATGALLAALDGTGTTLVVGSDLRDGLPGSADEAAGGDAAAAVLVGEDGPAAPVVAELIGQASTTDEFVDRWRTPGEVRSRTWEERFGETRYVPLGREAFAAACKDAGVEPGGLARVAVTGMHTRAVRALTRALALGDGVALDDLDATVGQAGTAQPLLALTALVERSSPGDVVAIVALADGADALVFRVTGARDAWAPARTVDEQIAGGAGLPYAKFLNWRGMLPTEPPRRPEPQRVSSTAAWRSENWKFGFVGSEDRSSGAVHLPPARVSMRGGATDDMSPVVRADTLATIATFTVDRLAYSPSPPIVFAVLDFDGGGRTPVELCDVDADTVAIGDRVEMTFRRLYTADGIHDYFWKAKPVRAITAPADG